MSLTAHIVHLITDNLRSTLKLVNLLSLKQKQVNKNDLQVHPHWKKQSQDCSPQLTSIKTQFLTPN